MGISFVAEKGHEIGQHMIIEHIFGWEINLQL